VPLVSVMLRLPLLRDMLQLYEPTNCAVIFVPELKKPLDPNCWKPEDGPPLRNEFTFVAKPYAPIICWDSGELGPKSVLVFPYPNAQAENILFAFTSPASQVEKLLRRQLNRPSGLEGGTEGMINVW
jgi:hypothetical protein